MATRVKKISLTLQEVKDSHRFLKISMNNGKYVTSRVQIAGHKTTWAKSPDVVYSPGTGLAGIKGEIVDFLKACSDRNDDSAADVRNAFEQDKLITSSNHKEFSDYIEKITMQQHEISKSAKGAAAAVTAKIDLIDREFIPDLLALVREVRKQNGVSGCGSSKTNIIQSYLDAVRGTDKVFRIHGCDSSGKTGDSKLRTADRESLSKTTIPLADTGDLSYFYIPASHDEKRFVVNFMTLYFSHVDGLKPTEASAKARSFAEDLLSPYKKGRGGRKSSPSHKSRSSSRSMSRAKRSSSVKSSAGARERSVSRSRATSVPSRSPSVSPRRTASPVHTKSPVRVSTHASAHTKSPVRSSSPGTSPSQATTKQRFRLPVKAKPVA